MLIQTSAATTPVLVTLAGVVAGFVDASAGGSGLIALPPLSQALGADVDAIGTNEVCGVAAAAVALAVYVRRGRMDWRNSLVFAIAVELGGFFGGLIAPRMPAWMFPWLLAPACPIILYVVRRSDAISGHGHRAVLEGSSRPERLRADGWVPIRTRARVYGSVRVLSARR